MTVILFLIILGALIFVHELGHFITAKKAGIRVDEFALGFPPKLASKKIGETLYSLNLVPFGGYVKIFGEDPEITDERKSERRIHANEESPLPKGVDALRAPGVVIPSALEDSGTSLAREDATLPAEDGGTPVVKGDDSRRFTSKSKWVQALMLSSGVLGNIVFAWLLISIGFMSGIPSSVEGRYAKEVKNPTLMITSVLPGSPAENGGLKAGDAIFSLTRDSRTHRASEGNAEAARDFIGESAGALAIEFKRGGEIQTTRVEPVFGIVEGKPAIGVTLDAVGVAQFGFFRSLFEGLLMTWDLLREVAIGLAGFIKQAFLGQADFSAIAGPVGIAGLVGEARVLGLVYLLSFTAFISINLAVINLLPIPALDGGRLLFLAIEGISRRAIPPRVTRALNATGFALLILLMAVITYRDIVKLL